MEVMKEAFDREDFTALFHEKPFDEVNGSGKHINWSVNYYLNGKRKNLFKPGSVDEELFLLFTLLKLKAILSNQKLYLSSVCVPGNELRLGGHEAPPRIMSAFLGDSVTAMINKLPEKQRLNLKEKLNFLVSNILQEDTDRNRTSPYAFTSNRFEFRAAGSTQNCLFPSIVIFSTMA
jgi:glutamine synthetase